VSRGLPVPTDRQGRNVLHREMYVRGLDPETVAAEAGISPSTVHRAMAGKPITGPRLLAISRVVKRHPVDPDLQALLNGDLEQPEERAS
jgi:hypothetical protein